MIRLAALVFLLLMPALLQAQGGAIRPILEMELSSDEVMPGTPVQLSISVMVPTWMAEPPAFPDLEVPHLMVRRPPDSVRSTRRRINRQMWVGVKRDFLLYPMVPGEFVIPPRPLLVTYAHPDTRAPVNVTVMTNPVRLFGVVPDEARGLDPFVAAEAITLTQSLQGLSGEMRVGQALSRELTATIEGTSPLFLPALLPAWTAPGVAVYPAEPVVDDSSSGEGEIGGTRIESVSYAIEQGGHFELPAVELRWFNLTTRSIETATVEPVVFVAELTLAQRLERHWRLAAAVVLFLALLLWLAFRLFPRLLIRLRAGYRAARSCYRYSAYYSARMAHRAIRRRDLDATLKHIRTWLGRLPPGANPDISGLRESLAQVGRTRYGDTGDAESGDWSAVGQALRDARRSSRQRRRQARDDETLPPLNPLPGQQL